MKQLRPRAGQLRRPTPRARLGLALLLGLAALTGSAFLVIADAASWGVRWTGHAAVSAAPLLLVAGAIAAVSLAHPPPGRHGFLRLVAVLAFTAWGLAQLFPASPRAGALNDAAILLFVIDAAYVVVSDAYAGRQDRPMGQDRNDPAAPRRNAPAIRSIGPVLNQLPPAWLCRAAQPPAVAAGAPPASTTGSPSDVLVPQGRPIACGLSPAIFRIGANPL